MAGCLFIEVARQAAWIGRILSFGAAYDGTVYAVVAARAGVTALQASAAWMLWQRLPAGPLFGQIALGVSAVLLVGEIGFRLAPSSITPGFRWPLVIAYAGYAGLGVLILRRLRSDR
jgi:hypothetical protein